MELLFKAAVTVVKKKLIRIRIITKLYSHAHSFFKTKITIKKQVFNKPYLLFIEMQRPTVISGYEKFDFLKPKAVASELRKLANFCTHDRKAERMYMM